MTDQKLLKRIFKLYDAIHPGSRHAIRWVIPQTYRDQIVTMQPKHPVSDVFYLTGTTPPVTGPDVLLGLPVRIGGSHIQIEVIRR